MRIFEAKDYKYRVRKPLKEKNVSVEYVRLAKALKNIVDTEGQGVYSEVAKLSADDSSSISPQHIKMIDTITPQISMLLSNERFIDDETIIEQMYCGLLRAGYSRNIIKGLVYAVFFSLNKTLKISNTERKKLSGDDIFSYQSESTVIVNDDNLDEIKSHIEQNDTNTMVELGTAILSGKLEKIKNEGYAVRLLEEGLNHGSGKAAQVLGDNNLVHAINASISNDYYSKAYEYYTAYGAITSNSPRISHSRIIDILNLGLFHKKMLFNYIVTAVIFSLSFFVPYMLALLDLNIPLMISVRSCAIFTIIEMMTVVIGAVVRYVRPFFTQGWIMFLQFFIWFIAMIIMIP